MEEFKNYSPEIKGIDIEVLKQDWIEICTGESSEQPKRGEHAGAKFASKQNLDEYYAIYFVAEVEDGYFRLCVHTPAGEDVPLQRINVYTVKPEGFLTADVKNNPKGYEYVFPVGESTAIKFKVYGFKWSSAASLK